MRWEQWYRKSCAFYFAAMAVGAVTGTLLKATWPDALMAAAASFIAGAWWPAAPPETKEEPKP